MALLYIKACGTGVDGLLQQCADHAVFVEVPETYMRLRTRPRVEDEGAHGAAAAGVCPVRAQPALQPWVQALRARRPL